VRRADNKDFPNSITTTDAQGPALLVPAYFAPGAEWDALALAGPDVGIVVFNPASGPGSQPDTRYNDHLAALRAAGIRIVGYVDTAFGERAAAAVIEDIAHHRSWYAVDGVFLDQVSVDCSQLTYYLQLATEARSRGIQLVVLNPGTQPCACLLGAGDIIVTVENDADTYLDGVVVPDWVRHYPPDRFCHLVHGATGARRLAAVVTAARQRRAGWVYVTPLPAGRLRNGLAATHPWAGLPRPRYWAALLDAVSTETSSDELEPTGETT
jgi:hypothetical protein